MSSKASALAIVGLTAVCLGLLWSNQQKNNETALNSGFLSAQQSASALDVGAVSVASRENQSFAPDRYVTILSVIQNDNDKHKALKLLEKNRSSLMESLKALGVKSGDIEPSSLGVKEDWSWVNGKRVDKGFNAVQEIQIYSSSRDAADSLENLLATFPFVQSVKTKGRLRNADSAEVLTIRKACQKASQMATEYAGGVHSKIGDVYSVKGNSSVNLYGNSDSVEVSANVAVEFRLDGVKDGGKSYVEVSQDESRKFAADKFIAITNVYMKGSDKNQLHKTALQKMDSVFTLAKNLGVAESELDVEGMTVRRRHSYDVNKDKDKSNIFEAFQTVRVNFVSKKEAATFIAEISPMKNVTVSRVHSDLRNKDSLHVQVVNAAGAKALARAKALAEGFDRKMGRVVYVGNDAGTGVKPLVEYQGMGRSLNEEYGLSGLLGGAEGDEMNIADSVEISAFLKVITEMD